MVRFACILLLLQVVIAGNAQHTNSWISFDQFYFKVPVAKDGIYRLTYDQLRQSGFPVDDVDPQKLQLFHRGKEQAILVSGADDGTFDSQDFIEFFGTRNDGTLDAFLYADRTNQPHALYNLFSDTTSFFLTAGTGAGKRMMVSPPATGPAVSHSLHLAESLVILADDYARGLTQNGEIFSSTFDQGEGWTSTAIRNGQSRDLVVPNIVRGVPDGPAPRLELLLMGRNPIEHTVEVFVGISLRPIASLRIDPFRPELVTAELQWSDFTTDGKLTVRVRVPDKGYPDRISTSFVRVIFPQSLYVEGSAGMEINTAPEPSGTLSIELQNVSTPIRLFDITETGSVTLISPDTSPFTFKLSSAQQSRKLYAVSTVMVPDRVIPVSFHEYSIADPAYIIISHPLVRRPAGGFADPVYSYGAYRASPEGGSYNTLVVNVGELYDQFSFGEKSPLAIYKFLEFIGAAQRPAYLFLVGKGLDYSQKYYRTLTAGAWEFQDLVPTGGAPGSDELFSEGIGGVPTGRLPAMKPEHVASYLNKVKETESLPFDALWRKRIMHLSGGVQEWEPAVFKSYLQDYQAIAEGPYLGGTVDAIAKQSRDVQIINISEEVNDGTGLITFFGHSSASTLDFDIGFVTNKVLGYNNKGKYPMLLMNGCEAGAFFQRRKLFGEDWVLADNAGATGFVAHNSFALIQNLYRFSGMFYDVAFADSLFIARGIGDIKLETGKRYLSDAPYSLSNSSQVQQMILLGDPAVRLFGATKPDLHIDENQISVVPYGGERVTAQSDSFAIKIVVKNYGFHKPALFRIEVRRSFPDNSFVLYDSVYNTPANTDTVLFVIRKGNEIPFGNNEFTIVADADNLIDELDETNNEAAYTLLIPANGTKNLSPSAFSIVRNEQVRLTFQATDVFSEERDFLVDLDTARSYSSPFAKRYTVRGKVLVTVPVELAHGDSVAYYWRTRLAEPLENELNEWAESSFTYMRHGDEGWAQVHFPQFMSNETRGLALMENARRIEFKKSVTPVDIITFGALSGKPRDSVSVKIDGAEYNLYTQGFGCRMNTINLIAFDRRSTTPYAGVYLPWYVILYEYSGRRLLCGREPFVINSFMPDEVSTGKNDLIAYIDNVSEGDSVVLFNIGSADIHLWPPDAINKLAELGVSFEQVSSLTVGEAFVIFGRKGADPGGAVVFHDHGPSPASARLNVEKTVSGGFNDGLMRTPVIGPARRWNTLTWKVAEVYTNDVIRYDIIGISTNGEEVPLAAGTSQVYDLSGIDHEIFPNVKVVFHTRDDVLLTPAQHVSWIVTFEPVPEGVLLPLDEKKVDVLHEGDSIERNFRFVNISEKSFTDSLIVKSSLFNRGRSERSTFTSKIKAPAPGDTTSFRIRLNSLSFGGTNDLDVFVNPRLQSERLYDNNLIQMWGAVHVIEDRVGPVVDVTFDRRHIQNGDYVSPSPLIRISIWDENDFLPKTDTSGVYITLYPCKDKGCTPRMVYFSDADVSWYAASGEMPFYIDFNPALEEGEYLLVVTGADAKGNQAGSPLGITFNVSRITSVTFPLPYPNPFFAETNFEVIISGDESPSLITLELRDLTGKAVYASPLNENKGIGVNRMSWNGTDSGGHRLQPGVYLYSFRITIGGEHHEVRGKIVLGGVPGTY
jgi:hypothetical protein